MKLALINRSASSERPATGALEDSNPERYRAFGLRQLADIAQLAQLSAAQRFEISVVGRVLPFRVNRYLIEQLINWSNVERDPVFQLVFPQRDMLRPAHFDAVAALLKSNADKAAIAAKVAQIRAELNPHPAGQQQHNVPCLNGVAVDGVQHKYRETMLLFPREGQTCHAYCSFCFRWPQFVGDPDLKFATEVRKKDQPSWVSYLQSKPDVSDVLITGGDPMVMKTPVLLAYLDRLLQPGLEHVRNIRIGSKALTFWPQRFVSDRDSEALMRAFERVAKAGKQLAFMAHINHWQELDSDVCHEAIRRIRNTGAVIRTQAPVMRHINDDAVTWAKMWKQQVGLGLVPYYMFIARDTGAQRYFEVPLTRVVDIYRKAVRVSSGLARTARGPSMSAGPGKVEIQGVATIHGEKVFVLRFVQARRSEWVQRPFFARYDQHATWLQDLKPAFGDNRFFFEELAADAN